MYQSYHELGGRMCGIGTIIEMHLTLVEKCGTISDERTMSHI